MMNYFSKQFQIRCDGDIVKHKANTFDFTIIPAFENCTYFVKCQNMRVYDAVETILLDLEYDEVSAITDNVLTAIKAAGAAIEVINK